MLGIRQREGEMRQTWSVMVVDFFAHFSQIGAMVLLISPEQIELESCACIEIEALEDSDRWLYLDDTQDLSEGEMRQIWSTVVVAIFALFC